MARRAVRESLVLLKNDDGRCRSSKSAKRIHVAGKQRRRHRQPVRRLDHHLAGRERDADHGGTTILAAHARRRSGRARRSRTRKDGAGAAGADVGVVVVGETPYAEFIGDRADLSLAAEDRAAIAQRQEGGRPGGGGRRLRAGR